MTALRLILLGLVALTVLLVVAAIIDLREAYRRVDGVSELFASPYGRIEYRQGGSGPVVLVIHGSGGGFDQGELVAQAVLGEGFRWIAPSRFGYLRSSLPERATFEEQAHAYALLLDALGVKRVAVVALSHGGPSALLFAALHPERVSSLTLISCGVASAATAEQSAANEKGDRLTAIYRHDALYWIASRFLRRQLLDLLGAGPAVLATLDPAQRKLTDRIIDYMNPVSPRSAGVAFDNKADMPNERIAAVHAPTLVIHATDDTLQLYRNAEYAMARIRGARLLRFEQGGHLLLAVRQQEIRAETQAFIRRHAGNT